MATLRSIDSDGGAQPREPARVPRASLQTGHRLGCLGCAGPAQPNKAIFRNFSDFSKNRFLALFFDSGALGTISDRSGMRKYPRGLIFSSGAQFWTSFVGIGRVGQKNPNLETRFFSRNSLFS